MKVEIDLDMEELCSNLVSHIDTNDLASNIELDYSQIEIDYYLLHNEIDYDSMAEKIDAKDVAKSVNQFDVAQALVEQDNFSFILSRAIEPHLETLAEKIASKLNSEPKKDNEALKQAIITALAAL
jgi:hypothetical protein